MSRRIRTMAITTAMTLALGMGVAGTAHAATTSPDPGTYTALPMPSTMNQGDGVWKPTGGARIFVPRAQADEVSHTAEQLSSALATIKVPRAEALPIVIGDDSQIRPTDIVLRLGAVPSMTSSEAYSLSVKQPVTVTGVGAAGLFYGTMQIVQNLTANGDVPNGEYSSSPVMKERTFNLDMARTFFSAATLKDAIRQMAYVGMNTLIMHFSENEGFRIESKLHPEIVSADHLTQDEVKDLISFAHDLHIQVIPSIDMPGHLQQALKTHPELQLPNKYGTTLTTALNITTDAGLTFADDLIEEFGKLFRDAGCTQWDVGVDEFIPESSMSQYPALAAKAQEIYDDPNANGFDLETWFANRMDDKLKAMGYTTVRTWSDGLMRGASSKATLNKDITVQYWTTWEQNMSPLQRYLDNGNKVVNFNDKYFYYAVHSGAYPVLPTAEAMWKDSWVPGIFPTRPGGIPQVIESPYPDQFGGVAFSVWCDDPNYWTGDQIIANIQQPFRGMAERTWNDGSTLTIDQFNAANTAIANAPGVDTPSAAPGKVTVLPVDVDLSVAVSSGSVHIGEDLTITGSGFLAGDQIDVTLHSTPVHIATINADANGAFTDTWSVPEGTPTGEHTIQITRTADGQSAQTTVRILAADSGTTPSGGTPGAGGGSGAALPATGSNASTLMFMSIALMVAGGLALAITRRTMRKNRG